MVECSTSSCPAARAGRCGNLRFSRRQYPLLQVTHGWLAPPSLPGIQVLPSGDRGWGLYNRSFIVGGQFVIEYVGELITMAEFRYDYG